MFQIILLLLKLVWQSSTCCKDDLSSLNKVISTMWSLFFIRKERELKGVIFGEDNIPCFILKFCWKQSEIPIQYTTEILNK